MCGINGYWKRNYNKEDGFDLLKLMNSKVGHRGPDGEGYWQDDNIGLAHKRLSIIDLSKGDQPMVSANNRYVIVFNGEIYNYKIKCVEFQE